MDVCEVQCLNEERVERVRGNALTAVEVLGLTETFKTLGGATRIGILHALSTEELCVCQLSEILGMTQTAISHQLSSLRKLRLVKYRKVGKMVFYSLDDEHVLNLFAEGLDHVRHR